MKKITVLLGVNQQGELIFGEFGVSPTSYGNGRVDYNKTYFSASFNCNAPFVASDDFLENRISGMLESFPKEELYDMCEHYDCTPYELEENYMKDNSVLEIIDCSLYPECFSVEGLEADVYFESTSCGQHDTRKEGMDININKEFYDLLHKLWDKYHLESIPKDEYQKLMDKYHEVYDNFHEDKWIQQWLDYLVQEGEL